MTADSTRETTGSDDALGRIAGALERIDGHLAKFAALADHYRPAIDRAARLADTPAARIAGVMGGRRRG